MNTYQVTERQSETLTRIYTISGPRVDTIRSFWDYLVAQGVIDGYELSNE